VDWNRTTVDGSAQTCASVDDLTSAELTERSGSHKNLIIMEVSGKTSEKAISPNDVAATPEAQPAAVEEVSLFHVVSG
jgi:hypothetical protein